MAEIDLNILTLSISKERGNRGVALLVGGEPESEHVVNGIAGH